jgi:prepilin-type N-terminal cleavage/methylation domain-containing protein
MDCHRPHGARVRRGFSIVELVVAMMLVAVGVLSLVGANAVFVRRRIEARRRLAAVAAASNRVARLSSSSCLPTSGTANGPFGVAERWTVVMRGNATREIADSVSFGANPAHELVVRTRLPC